MNLIFRNEINYFNHKKKLNSKWYSGETGIRPIDDSIKFAFKTGYLHHIIRLMIMSNFMNLCRLDPYECYKWFMEFAVDSYDWVMIQNVYSMGQWADGGLTMRKPYISSDNYVVLVAAAGGNGNQYVGARLDFIDIQADYTRHSSSYWPPKVTAVSYSDNTTGVY